MHCRSLCRTGMAAVMLRTMVAAATRTGAGAVV